ncbi:MAG: hypothetical protein AUJ98_04635, partial [Bacteroidetes bacterium CG2_30_33_31]
SDKNAASHWNTSPNYNVWFKFQATTANMKITVNRGGTKGTIQAVNLALWQSNGTTEISSKRYTNNSDIVVVEVISALTVGNWYYISVDNYYAPYQGSFTLCLEDNNISYDYYEGALDVSSLINSCSADAAYTTYNMTSDKNAASHWNTSPNYNVWFKFQATNTTMFVNVERGGTKGTIQGLNAALWQSNGTTEVKSRRYTNISDTVTLTADGLLTIGNWYYISVDNYYAPFQGSFTICLDDGTEGGALPISLLDLSALKNKDVINLYWKTASEQNNDYFIIERSADNINFQNIGNIDGSGNSINIIDYNFIDNQPNNGINYYRLKQVDFDGKFTYSKTISADFINENLIFNIFPNPISHTETLIIKFNNGQQNTTKLEIITSLGQIVKTISLTKDEKYSNQYIISDLPPRGIYFIRIYSGNRVLEKKLVVL